MCYIIFIKFGRLFALVNRKSTFFVILAGTLWGLISIFIRQLAVAGFDSLQIAFIRMLVSSSIFSLFLLFKKRQLFIIKLKDLWMFFGTGIVSVAFFNFCYFYTIIKSEASLAVVLLYTSPVFVVLLSAVLFKETITSNKILALVLTFIGCILVSGLAGGLSIKPFILLTGIGSGLFYALYSIFGRIALEKYDSATVTCYTFIFGLIGILPFSQIKSTFAIISTKPSVIFWCFGIGIVSTILPYFFYTKGLEKLESGKAAILVAVEPLVGSIIGMTLLKESHSPVKIAGIAFIILSIFILNINFKKEKSYGLQEK